jgi:phosphate-selective porin OprO/OprP
VSPGFVFAQQPSIDNNIEAASSDAQPKRKFSKWNQYDGPLTTLNWGGGFLYEYAAYSQDEESKQQIELEPKAKVRDSRLLFNGRFKSERKITWCAGIMYDGPTDNWLVRQTGIMVEVPELLGNFFIGRAKEGFSMNKVMNGYTGWTMERATMNDATIPILADGVKWLGTTPSNRFLWNIGYFQDTLSEGEGFSTYDHQFVTRLMWLPLFSEPDAKVLHLGVNGRYGKVDDGKLRYKSVPEASPAPNFVDTGKFAAEYTQMAGGEAYYRSGPWLFGSEYWFSSADSPATGDPTVHGGDIAVTWIITGETRPYNSGEGFFGRVVPDRPVTKGGPGAWELVVRHSYIDLDDKGLHGGKFWRLTPMVNWYPTNEFRFEAAYGYGALDRFDLKGKTQFFQCRVQIWI